MKPFRALRPQLLTSHADNPSGSYSWIIAEEPIETYYMYWRGKPGDQSQGWCIQIPYSRDGERLVWRKFVSKASYGGTKASLKRIALKLRDKQMEKLNVYDRGLGMYHRRRSPRNSSGFVGIRLTEADFKGSGHWQWEARWSKGKGKIARRTFSVALHGFEPARQQAIVAREEALKERAGAANSK